MTPLITVSLRHQKDVVAARQRARQLAGLLGFRQNEQSRIATAVSEIARNAFRYGTGGKVVIGLDSHVGRQKLHIRVTDEGPGIPHLTAVLEGEYESRTGMGQGIVGARRLMDAFDIRSDQHGTHVAMSVALPADAQHVDNARLERIVKVLASSKDSPVDELHQQNHDLLHALEELRERNGELERLRTELEDTNRGVVALYAELQDQADQLKRANDMRAQFMSYMSHEFRTPLDSIIALSGLLLSAVDGPLAPEQRKQVDLMRRSARDLLTLVDDLLDNARLEAGQITIRPTSFLVADLFSALRATLRPLLTSDAVDLQFEMSHHLPPMFTDEGRLSQILRNLISNALKFTEVGTVALSARARGDVIDFTVTDTGVGIEPWAIERIFEDYMQVETPLQRHRKGSGLGLPLSRKLARMLGGDIAAESTPGIGSTFTVSVPVIYVPLELESHAIETS